MSAGDTEGQEATMFVKTKSGKTVHASTYRDGSPLCDQLNQDDSKYNQVEADEVTCKRCIKAIVGQTTYAARQWDPETLQERPIAPAEETVAVVTRIVKGVPFFQMTASTGTTSRTMVLDGPALEYFQDGLGRRRVRVGDRMIVGADRNDQGDPVIGYRMNRRDRRRAAK